MLLHADVRADGSPSLCGNIDEVVNVPADLAPHTHVARWLILRKIETRDVTHEPAINEKAVVTQIMKPVRQTEHRSSIVALLCFYDDIGALSRDRVDCALYHLLFVSFDVDLDKPD